MPQSILSSYTAKPQFTAINEATGQPLWKGLAIEDIEINEPSANTDSPLFTEQVSDDSTARKFMASEIGTIKIIQPAKLRVKGITNDISILENVIQSFLDTTLTVGITTKSIIVNNLVPVELQIEQTAEMISASRLTIQFEQAIPPQPQTYDPAQPPDQDVYGITVQAPKQVLLTGSSLMAGLSNFRLPPLPLDLN